MDEKWIPDKNYKKILESMPIPCVDLVIYHEKKVLLVYRQGASFRDQWGIPGGRVYKNEKLKDAVKRKALEEVGLNVKVKRKLGSYEGFDENTGFDDVKSGTHTIATGYVVEPVDGTDVKLDGHGSEYRWFGKIENEFHPYIKKILKDSGVFSHGV